jgi:hypothetical protein
MGLSISLTNNQVDLASYLNTSVSGTVYFNVSRIYTNTTANKILYLVAYSFNAMTAANITNITFTATRIA